MTHCPRAPQKRAKSVRENHKPMKCSPARSDIVRGPRASFTFALRKSARRGKE